MQRILLALSVLALAVSVTVALLWAMPGPTTATAIGTNIITSPDTSGDILLAVGQSTSLALEGGSNPVVSYYDATNGDLKVLHCGNATCTAGNTIASPDTGGDVGLYGSLALDTNGYPVISYYDATNGDLKVLHCGNATCTADNSITSPDTGANVGGIVGTDTSLVLDGGGNPVVSYGGSGDLTVLRCGDPNCTAGNTITSPDTSGDVGFETSIALDVAGNPVVSYQNFTNGHLKVLHCGNATCASGNTITTPDTGRASEISITLDQDGNPVVSYREWINLDLKVLRCNDPNCAGGDESITSPDTGDDAGRFTSLALDGSGNPVVSYLDGTNRDLKVLHCDDANCSGTGESITSPDTGGDVGHYTSLVLDVGGNPVVSYIDSGGDLKVLHCGDPDCTGVKPTPTSDIPNDEQPMPVAPPAAGTGRPAPGNATLAWSYILGAAGMLLLISGVAWLGTNGRRASKTAN